MRIRHKPWARPELAACEFCLDDIYAHAGSWAQCFDGSQPFALELGCGKGAFIAELAWQTPRVNYLAIDLKSEMLGLAVRKARQRFGEVTPPNLRFAACDIERLQSAFTTGDKVERLYINFCTPWEKQRYKKHRLTHPMLLERYKCFLAPEATLCFKSDHEGLYRDTLEYLAECGFTVDFSTESLCAENAPEPCFLVRTEHETQFIAEGKPIFALRAVLTKAP